MRTEVIITIQDEAGHLKYDLEVPTDVAVDMLIDNIKEVLISCNGDLMYVQNYTSLYSERMRKELPYKQSLREIGVWNGDILILK